jgi:rare lipoprotein A
VQSDEGSTQTSRTVTRKLFQVGAASWYGEQYDGKTTASGEPFDMYDFTAAHATLPLGTFVRVTNLSNGKTVIVRVNDRGPFVSGRIIDVSYNAARVLDFLETGVQRVRLDFEECPRDTARTESAPRFATGDDRDSIAHSSVEGVARAASSRRHS